MAIELASAYVTLIPSAKGIAQGIAKEMGSPLEEAGKVSGDKTSKAFGDTFKTGISKAAKVAGVALAAGVVLLGKDSIKAASNLNESINAVKVVFGGAADAVLKIGKNSATSLGLSKNEFNGLAVRFSNFAQTVAGKGGDVAGTLGTLSTRAADFASVMNLEVGDAAELFQSGLAGETEPLRKFGIDLSAAAVKAFAAANGIGTLGQELTESEKVQARYGLLMASTNKVQGDFANTSDSLANRQRILKASFENSKAAIGTALIPALSAIMPVIEKLATGIGIVLPKVVAGFKAAFGWLIDHKEILIGVGITVGGVLIGLFASWVAGATAAAIATLTAAAPFIAIGVAVAAVAAAVLYAYNNFEWFRGAVLAVKDFIVNDLVPAFQAIWNFISTYIIPIISTLVETYIKVLIVQFQAIKWVITEVVIPAFMAVWRFIGDNVIPIVAAIASTIVTVGTTVGRVVGEIVGFVLGIPGRIGAVVSTLWEGIKTGISTAKQWVSDRIDDVVNIAINLPGRMAGLFTGMWDGIKNAFRSVLNTIIGWWNSLDFTFPGYDIPGPGPNIPGFTIGLPDIAKLHAGGVVPGPTGREVPIVAMAGEVVYTAAQNTAIEKALLGSAAMPPITIYNNRRDIGVADMNQVLAMARLAS